VTRKDKPATRVQTKDGEVLRISGQLPADPSWSKTKPMPEAPSQKYTQEGDNL
jgi:hypothetical protein